MEAESLQTELERIARELETSRHALGEVADGLGALWKALGPPEGAGHATADSETGQVVTNVSAASMAAARAAHANVTDTARVSKRALAAVAGPAEPGREPDATATARVPRPAAVVAPAEHASDATATARVPRPAGVMAPVEPDPDALATGRIPQPTGRTLTGTPDPDALATGRIPRPTGRTLTGTPDPDALATGRIPRPGATSTTDAPGDPAPPPGQSSDRVTIPLGQLTPPPGAGELQGGLADALRSAAEGDDAAEPDERPTGEFQRAQRDTLTYFFGVDGPAPDEETELGPVGGAPVDAPADAPADAKPPKPSQS